MYEIPQSTTTHPLVFFMAQSADKTTGVTGLTPTVTIRKVGGSFASPAGAVSEIANGWYQVAGNATDSNTLGPLLLHATGTGADPVDAVYDVVVPRPTATAITNFNTVFDTDFDNVYDATNDMWNAHVVLVNGEDPDTYFTDEAGIEDAVIAGLNGIEPQAVGTIAEGVWQFVINGTTWDSSGAAGEVVMDIIDDTGTSGVKVSSGTGSGQISVTSGVVAASGNWSTHAAADVWAVSTREITGGELSDAPPSAALIADSVWDEALSGHATAGSGGKTLADILVDTATSGVLVDAASVRAAVGLAGATLDNNLNAITDAIAGVAPDVLNSMLLDQGTAQSATATSLVLQAGASFADDVLIDSFIRITGGNTGVGQCKPITDYDSATKTATVAFDVTPTGTIAYEIWPNVKTANTEAEITEWVNNSTPAPEFFGNQPEVVASDPTEWATYKGKIDTIDTAAAAAQTAAESVDGKITSGRLSKIDRIQDTGTVAASSEVSGIALANLTAEKIAPGRTFRVAWEGNRSDNIVTLNTWSSGTITLAADFDGSNKSNGLNPGTTISSLDSVTVTNQADDTTVTTSELRVQQTLTAVNFDVAAIAAAGRFTVLIEVTTSDSQTLSMVGELVVQAP